MSWRRSEWLSVGTLVMVAGWIWWASSRVSAWDQVDTVVCDAHKGNDALNDRVTTLETHISDRDDEITRQLSAIYRKLDK